jgi:indolepyruvate ferredoxin oxidoreductase beta subunit
MSPLLPLGEANVIIGFELCETVRSLLMLNPNGGVILNSQIIKPVAVSLGIQKYDAGKMLDYLKEHVKNLIIIDALALANAAGSVKATNVVMLGAACGAGFLPLEKVAFMSVIGKNVPPKFQQLNENAFLSGYSFAQQAVTARPVKT